MIIVEEVSRKVGLSFGTELYLFFDGFIISTKSFPSEVDQLHESVDSEIAKNSYQG